MKKRGQITVFIITAIIIIAALILFGIFFLDNKDNEYFESPGVKPLYNNVYISILDCYEASILSGLDYLGLQGGYFKDVPIGVEFEEGVVVPYYYFEGEIEIPSLSDIEKNLEDYSDETLQFCLDEINGYENFELNNYKNLKSDVLINNRDIEVKTQGNIKIQREGKSINFKLSDHPIEVPSKLKDIHEVAKFITESHEINSAMYCISCVSEIAQEKDVYVDFSHNGLNTLVTISENITSSEPYYFRFINKYTGDEEFPSLREVILE